MTTYVPNQYLFIHPDSKRIDTSEGYLMTEVATESVRSTIALKEEMWIQVLVSENTCMLISRAAWRPSTKFNE